MQLFYIYIQAVFFLNFFIGWVGEDIGGTIERYDPAKDQWEYLTKMQEPRFSMGICVYDGLIYLVGGCTHSRRHMQELVSYNPVSLSYKIVTDRLPEIRVWKCRRLTVVLGVN